MPNKDGKITPSLEELVSIMARLRDPENGCPWDIQQDFRTIAPYTIEEAYEVADAIERDDMDALKDELGDLQLQVVYHSRMAEERGAFSVENVIEAICYKMVRRHPHVFGDQPSPGWESLKAAERSGSEDRSALAGVALALPALLRAEKLQKRAARTGFDWPDADGPAAKVEEELAEVRDAATADDRLEEVGDLLFAVVNLARHLKVDAEAALKQANIKFESRFRQMEAIAGDRFSGLPLDEKEKLWVEAKTKR